MRTIFTTKHEPWAYGAIYDEECSKEKALVFHANVYKDFSPLRVIKNAFILSACGNGDGGRIEAAVLGFGISLGLERETVFNMVCSLALELMTPFGDVHIGVGLVQQPKDPRWLAESE